MDNDHPALQQPLPDGTSEIALDSVVIRRDLYPRLKHDPALVQRYADNLEVMPPIEVNQYGHLIDGYHRYLAHQKVGASTIRVTITETTSDAELLALAAQRNAAHGWQLTNEDKRDVAIRLYNGGTGLSKEQIARVLSVSDRQVRNYLSDIDRQIREREEREVAELWMLGYTENEIAERTGVPRQTLNDWIRTLPKSETFPISAKSRDFAQDADWKPPLYTLWNYGRLTNAVEHFGNSEQRILENLLYLYTEPFDLVLDPFAGGGSTIDVCHARLRRCYASDRLVVPERTGQIRQHDIVTDGLPDLQRRWNDVSLTYLDPPYWKQAEGQYSDDPTDLANMPLEQFTDALVHLITDIARVQKRGAIALLIQPTQWHAPGRQVVDHVMDIVSRVRHDHLVLDYRIACPYSTEQCTPQMVEWAKQHKRLLMITRELVVWRVVRP